MTEKKYCDICGKEMDEFVHLYGSKYYLWGISSKFKSYDFCSEECFVKWVKEEFDLIENERSEDINKLSGFEEDEK